MPIGATVFAAGLLAASGQAPATASGYLENGTAVPATAVGTLSRAAVDSLDGPSLQIGARVKLAGEWVPSGELGGAVEWEESIDSPVQFFQFDLAGDERLVHRTAATWTRAPVEIWARQGPPGAVTEELRWKGFVRPPTEQDSLRRLLAVRCTDLAGPFLASTLCSEVEPFAGLRRGEIARELLADVGLSDVDIPPGRIWSKPLFTDGRPVFDFLRDFCEPEGWHWRRRPDGVVEAYVPRLKEAPAAPDHVWNVEDLVSLSTSTPDSPASRVVLRGVGIVLVDEAGLTTEVTTTEIQDLFTPARAVLLQATDGSTTPIAGAGPEATLQTVQRIVEQVVKRAGLVVSHTTDEFGWKNPRAGKLQSIDGAGPAGGYYYPQVFIDSNGEYVFWSAERFLQVGRRREVPSYDGEGTALGALIATSRWHGRTQGVKSVGGAWVSGARVGSDDQSYLAVDGSNAIEQYGQAEVVQLVFSYGAGGARVREVQETSTYYAPKAAVSDNAPVDYYVLYDGTGQAEIVANWRLSGRLDTQNFLSADGLVKGRSETTWTYAVNRVIGGVFDWGSFEANIAVERFQPTSRKLSLYRALSDDTVEEVTIDASGRRARVIPGRLPLPSYRGSVWTRMVQQPLELRIDDPVLEEWFGFRREVLSSDFIQDLDEAAAVLAQKRSRELVFTHTIVRPETLCRPGDTVRLVHRAAGIDHRCLLAKAKVRRDLATGSALGTYTLEQPL